MVMFVNARLSKLAEEYGEDVASEMLSRSRSNLNLSTMEAMPTMPYAAPQQPYHHAKYDSLDAKSPGPFSAL